MRSNCFNCEDQIFEVDSDKTKSIYRDNFEFILCRFICEVKMTKENGNSCQPSIIFYTFIAKL